MLSPRPPRACRRRRFRPLRRLGAGSALLLLAGCGAPDGPDLIFHGGPILTVDAGDRVAAAIAIEDGVIRAVGTAQQVLALAAPHTEVRDLEGRALVPGFVAAHEHPTLSAVFGGVVDVSGFRHATNEAVWSALREGVARAAKGEWIYAMGIDPILVPDLEMPDRASLDAVAPDQPLVVVAQSMHSFWANSRAFVEAGITRDTPDPGGGAFYERDARGELTGFVSESEAAAPLLRRLQAPWRLLGRYEAALDELLAAGFTSVASLGVNLPPLLARVAASRRFAPRIRQFFYLAESELGQLPEQPDSVDPFFRIQGIKLWHDGSPYTGSMFVEEPYLDTPLTRALRIAPGSRGAARLEAGTLQAVLDDFSERGWQVAVHSQGDRSSREVAEAFAKIPQRRARAPLRLEHGLLLPASLLPELARLGVSPSFHVNHILYYGDALEDSILGAERAAKLLPVRSAFELGMQPTLHADSPMFPPDALRLMQTAVLRRTRSGRVLGAEQAIRAEQALRAMTIHGAHQLGVARELGSLEVGKWADLVVLSASPYEIAPERLDRVEVLEVFVAGRRRLPRPE